MADGKSLTAEKTFTPDTPDGSIEMEFHFDALKVSGLETVVFETLLAGETVVAEHKDLTDEGQKVNITILRTFAWNRDTEDQVGEAKKDVVIYDEVFYKGCRIGAEYTIKGTLMNKKTGEPLKDAAGNEVTAEKTFTAQQHDGSEILEFKFDASLLKGTTTVAYEKLFHQDIEVAVHEDLQDKDQTTYFPEISTTAHDDITLLDHTEAIENASITDVVKYTNLLPGKEYTMKGVLMDKKTGEPVLIDGKQVTSEATFTAEAEEGEVEMTFTFDASKIAGSTVVVFEECFYGETRVAEHQDIEDEGQTIYIIILETELLAEDTEDHVTEADEEVVVYDEVFYKSCKPGAEYTIKGVLMDKATGEPMKDAEGNEITAEKTFTAKAADGSEILEFRFDGSLLKGTTTVAFETMYHQDKEVATHTDLEDEDQTTYLPEIGTLAHDSVTLLDHTEATENAEIVDTVSYTNLLPGKEYTMKGVLMDQKTGEPVLIDGEQVTSEASFTAEAEEGEVEMTFTFDASKIKGTTVVVFEECFYGETRVAKHQDIEDEGQTIYIIELQTELLAEDTKDHVTEADEEVVVYDEVFYKSCKPGAEYTIKGVLMDKATGEPMKDAEGNEITAEKTFTAKTADGSEILEFKFDGSLLKGTTTVAFETMYHQDKEVATHTDIEDEDQTTYLPEIGTTAIADETEDHVVKAQEELTITDTVHYTNLLPGRTYVMKGVLMDKKNGNALLIDGKEVTAETEFTADETEGDVEVVFTFDASALAGTTLVVFEECFLEETRVAKHQDIEDEGQTIYIPEIGTKAHDNQTEIDHSQVAKEITLIDVVSYTNLLPGKEYVMKGILMDKKTGEPVLVDGKEVTSEVPFTPETSEGEVEMTFVFAGEELEANPIVVFETCYYNDVEVADHRNPEDEDQSDYIPEIGTEALAKDTEEHITLADETVEIVDTVSYKGLKPNTKYEMTGVLMDQESGKAILVDGKEVTSSVTFVTGEAEEGEVKVDGEVEVTFSFDGRAFAGTTIVVFETLIQSGKEVAVHADIEDEAQFVHIPEAETELKDKATEDHDAHLDEKVELVDTVKYTNLIPGKEYTVKGTLMVKSTGKALLVDGKEVTAEKTFTAEKADGEVELTFTISTLDLAGETIVAFEKVLYNDIPVAVHEDLEDEDQSVDIPEVGTKAKDQASGSSTMTLSTRAVLVDTVSYKGLTPGKEYTVKGEIMDKATGKSIGVTAEQKFTAEAMDGTVDVLFTINTENFQGKSLVVFEKLYDAKGNLLAEHEDINDTEQTVNVPTKPPTVKTGDGANPMLYGILMLLSLILAAGAAFGLKKRGALKNL